MTSLKPIPFPNTSQGNPTQHRAMTIAEGRQLSRLVETNMWNFDISTAPRGRMEAVEGMRLYAGNQIEYVREHHIPEPIWAATRGGEVIKTHWIPPKGKDGGRWVNLASNEEPIAWQPFVKPVHPNLGNQERRVCGIPVKVDNRIPAGEAHFVDSHGKIVGSIINVGEV